MKPLKVGVRLGLVVGLLLVSYYLGRPLYWEIQSRLPEFRLPSRYIISPSSVQELHPRGSDPDPVEGSSTFDETDTSTEKVSEEKTDELTEQSTTVSSKSTLQEELTKPIWEVPLAGSKFPSRKAFALRKEMVEFRAKKNVIVVTFANHAFMGFVLSWVKSLTDDGVTNILVGNALILG